MASSSVVPPKEKYDVFISFRGLDTRQNFTSHLHAALIRRRVETFIDYRLERGDEVGPALYKAIEGSKISVIIFSENYASSTWCLDELAYILKCKNKYGRLVIPIFYKVEPAHVRRQTKTYGTAFAKHEQRPEDKVAEWKEALVEAADLSGFVSTSQTVRDDADLVEKVVRDVLAKLNREQSIDLTRLIGAEGRIQKILLELDIIPDDVRVRCVVLWGPGGIGKTTLGEAVYYGLCSQFETHYFLASVRERSGTKQAFSSELCALRNELLGQLLDGSNANIQTPTIDNGTKSRLSRAKVLVVLDDVNDSSQLKFLAGEVPFGPGSRIIVTTRNIKPVKDTLVEENDVKIYKVEELNEDESLQLLQSNAPMPARNSQVLKKLVDYAAGVPLTLQILRPLCKCKMEEQLGMLWAKLKKFPSERLRNVYTASYDGLERNEKEIFLDLACFHKGEKRYKAEMILAACDLFPDDGIDTLIDMSLISIKDDCIWMHDVIQEMAWETVREESRQNPGERSRLHNYEDVRNVLIRNKGTANVHYISCRSYSGAKQLKWVEQAFKEMHNLRFLVLSGIDHLDGIKDLGYLPDALRYLDWNEYPLQSLPSKFSPDNLVELHMPYSKLKRLWGESQNLNNLKRIDLKYSVDLAEVGELSNSVNIESIDLQGCQSLVEVPDLSKCTHINSINLAGCERLEQVPPYFKNFTKLTHLDLRRCSNLRTLPELPGKIEFLGITKTAIQELTSSVCSLEKLRQLDLDSCSSIKKFSSIPWKMRSLNHLCLRKTNIERVPSSSFLFMTEITSLDLRDCDLLVSLPADICELKSLETLDLSGCSSFTTFPEIAEPLEHLRDLNLSKTNLKELPSRFGNLVGIKKLNLSGCTNLESLPDSFNKFKFLEWFSLYGCVKLKELPLRLILSSLKHLDLEGCELVKEIPDCSTSFPALQSLDLSGTMIETIPPSIKKVSGLKSLRVRKCKRLQSLPVLPCLLEKLDAEGCTRLETMSLSMAAHTQGLDEMLSDMEFNVSRTECHSFLGCVKLDEISKCRIMDDAHFRIRRMATASDLKRSARDDDLAVICPGNEIPKWFNYQTLQGSSLNIKLPVHWSDDSNFLGIALCSVFAISAYRDFLRCDCEMILKNNGETHTVNLGTEHFVSSAVTFETDHTLVWYVHGISDEAKSSTEASFNFYTKVSGRKLYNVKSCGVCFLRNVYTTNISRTHSTSKVVRDDADLVDKIFSDVLAKLKREQSIDLTRLIGAEGRIQKILLELDIIPDDVRVRYVVLWGPGGIGKTTLAEAVYYGLSSQFETHCFLANVRERSGTKQAFSPKLCALRNELLGQLLDGCNVNIQTQTIDNGTVSRLHRAKVLVVLDDVSDSSQLRYLAGEVPFGPGSRIIITTRDQKPVKDTLLLKDVANYDVKIHQVEMLNEVESLQLLQSHAPMHAGNSQFLHKLVNIAAGIPLALEILAKLVLQCETEEELSLLWDQLRTSGDNELRKIYRVSVDRLKTSSREIFLDLACFHNGEKRCDVERILAACGLFPETGIKNLIDTSLIAIKDGRIWMEDLIQEMAWEIVRQENPNNPGERSRLHNYKDVHHVLENNKGTASMQSISYSKDKLKLDPEAFTRMTNLRFLKLKSYHDKDMANLECLPGALRYLDWEAYPFRSLPSKFSPDNLVELHMPSSYLERLWGKSQNLNNLKKIDLSRSIFLAEVEGLSNSVNIESIDLQCCTRLVEVPNLSKCTHIKSINLKGCENLVQVPDLSNGLNIESINLERCVALYQVPPYSERCDLAEVGGLSNSVNIESIDLAGCRSLIEVPDLSKCTYLKSINLAGVFLKEIPDYFTSLLTLQSLDLSETMIETIPPRIKQVSWLKSLRVRNCKQLQSLPVLPCLLEKLDATECTRLETASVSVTAHTHGLDEMLLEQNFRTESHSFFGCVNLDEISKSRVMDDAHFRIMRMATASNIKGSTRGNVTVICPGNEIPKWISYRNPKGSSLNIKLPLRWSEDSNFLGIALCSVTSTSIFSAHREFKCEMILKTSNSETHTVYLGFPDINVSVYGRLFCTDYVLVWYESFDTARIASDEAKWYTEASFHFYTEVLGEKINSVERCGVSFLYAQPQDDDASLKFEVIPPQQVDTTRRRHFEDDASYSEQNKKRG